MSNTIDGPRLYRQANSRARSRRIRPRQESTRMNHISLSSFPATLSNEPGRIEVPFVASEDESNSAEDISIETSEAKSSVPGPAPSAVGETVPTFLKSPTSDLKKQKRKRVFGLNRSSPPANKQSHSYATSNRFDYEQKYPKDRFGEELGPNARVWFTYLDEANVYDRDKVEGWRDTVDVLLVFAGLFSAVVTTFLSQSWQNLQQDFTQVSASLLFEMVQLQRAQFAGAHISSIPGSPLTPISPFSPSTNASLVNGLWFASLTISLSTALFSVLAKQWLLCYMSAVSGTAREKARVRHFRFQGLEKWKAGSIIDLLPILLHLALGLVLLGLVILVLPLDVQISWAVIVLSSITYILYFASVALPIWYAECPYTTSMTIFMDTMHYAVRLFVGSYERRLRHQYSYMSKVWAVTNRPIRLLKSSFRNAKRVISSLARPVWRYILVRTRIPHQNILSWCAQQREMKLKESIKATDRLNLRALHWLHRFSTNPSIQRIIARCVSTYPESVQESGLRFPLMTLANSLCPDEDVEDHCHVLSLQTQDGYLSRSTLDILARASVDRAEESYGCIETARKILQGDFVRVLRDAFEDPHFLTPLSVWNGLLSFAKTDAALAGHILCSSCLNPLDWGDWMDSGDWGDRSVDDGSGCGRSTLISISDAATSNRLNKPCFRYLSHCFCGEQLPINEEDFNSRYDLFLAIYRNLTSDQPFITDQAVLKECLEGLFSSLCTVISLEKPRVAKWMMSWEDPNRFSRDVLCGDAFWGDRMPRQARNGALKALDLLWECDVKNTGDTLHFFSANSQELHFIYQQCSKERYQGDVDYLLCASLFLPLFVPQNIKDLTAILRDEPPERAVSRFRHCFRYLRQAPLMVRGIELGRSHIFPHLTRLFKTLPRSDPLFSILRDKTILVELWACLTEHMETTVLEEFFDVLKLEFDPQGLKELYDLMVAEALSEIYQLKLFKSAYRFGRMIGIPVSEFTSAVGIQFRDDSPFVLRHYFQSAVEMVKAFDEEFNKEKRKHSHTLSNLLTRVRGTFQNLNSLPRKSSNDEIAV